MKDQLPRVNGQISVPLQGGPGRGKRLTIRRLTPWLHYMPEVMMPCDDIASGCMKVHTNLPMSLYKLVPETETTSPYYQHVTDEEAANSSG
jgi:hypothetical protein